MVIVTESCNSCFGRCFCGCFVKSREKYKNHVRAIYPSLEAEDQSKAQNLGPLASYAQASPHRLADIGRYLEKLIHRDLDEHRHGHVECGVQALVAVLQACSSSAQLALFEESVVNIIILLLERSQTELRIAALKAFEQYAQSKARRQSMGDDAIAMPSGSVALTTMSSNAAPAAGHKQLDLFFIYIVQMCCEGADPHLHRAALLALLRMLRCNSNSAAHFGGIVPALLTNLDQQAAVVPFESEADAPLHVIASLCLDEAARCATQETLPQLLNPLLRHFDSEHWQPSLSTAKALLTIAQQGFRTSNMRHIDRFVASLFRHAASVSFDDSAAVLNTGAFILSRASAPLGPWQNVLSSLLAVAPRHHALSTALQLAVIRACAALALRTQSSVDAFDMLQHILNDAVADVERQKLLFGAAFQVAKVCGAGGESSLQDPLLRVLLRSLRRSPSTAASLLLLDSLSYLLLPGATRSIIRIAPEDNREDLPADPIDENLADAQFFLQDSLGRSLRDAVKILSSASSENVSSTESAPVRRGSTFASFNTAKNFGAVSLSDSQRADLVAELLQAIRGAAALKHEAGLKAEVDSPIQLERIEMLSRSAALIDSEKADASLASARVLSSCFRALVQVIGTYTDPAECVVDIVPSISQLISLSNATLTSHILTASVLIVVASRLVQLNASSVAQSVVNLIRPYFVSWASVDNSAASEAALLVLTSNFGMLPAVDARSAQQSDEASDELGSCWTLVKQLPADLSASLIDILGKLPASASRGATSVRLRAAMAAQSSEPQSAKAGSRRLSLDSTLSSVVASLPDMWSAAAVQSSGTTVSVFKSSRTQLTLAALRAEEAAEEAVSQDLITVSLNESQGDALGESQDVDDVAAKAENSKARLNRLMQSVKSTPSDVRIALPAHSDGEEFEDKELATSLALVASFAHEGIHEQVMDNLTETPSTLWFNAEEAAEPAAFKHISSSVAKAAPASAPIAFSAKESALAAASLLLRQQGNEVDVDVSSVGRRASQGFMHLTNFQHQDLA